MIFRFMDTTLNSMPKIEEIPPSGQGVFSLVNSLWLRRPTYQDVNLADPNIAKKVMHYMEKIDF